MKFCMQCGKPMADAARFCGSCGAPAAVNETPNAAPPVQPQMPAPVPQMSQAPQQAVPQPQTWSAAPAQTVPAQAVPVPAAAPINVPPAGVSPVAPAPAAVVPAATTSAVAAAPRHGRRLAAIIAAIVAVAVGGTLAWAVPNVPAVRQILGIGAKNPGAVTAQVMQSMQHVSSAQFELTYSENYKGKGESPLFTAKGKYALGANTDASLFDMQVEQLSPQGSARLVWSNGAVGMHSRSNGSSEQYGYLDVNGLRDDLQSLLEYNLDSATAKQYTDLAFNVKDAIIRNGKVDGEGALKVFNDGMSSLNDEYAQEYRKYVPNDAANKQYGEFLTAFVTKELERDDVQARVFPGKSETKGSNGTTLSFGFNPTEFVHVLAEYWSANQNSYPDLRKTLVDSFSSSSDPEASYNDAIRQMREWQNNDESLNNLKVSLTYGLGYELRELDLSAQEYYTVVHWNLKLGDLNKVSSNDPDAAQFMSDAKAKNSMF